MSQLTLNMRLTEVKSKPRTDTKSGCSFILGDELTEKGQGDLAKRESMPEQGKVKLRLPDSKPLVLEISRMVIATNHLTGNVRMTLETAKEFSDSEIRWLHSKVGHSLDLEWAGAQQELFPGDAQGEGFEEDEEGGGKVIDHKPRLLEDKSEGDEKRKAE